MARTARLQLEAIEDRLAPAITIQFDFSLDAAGFFNDPARRAVLEQAGQHLSSRIQSQLQPITPGPGQSWTALFFSPATGQQVEVPNLHVPANTIIVYVGGRNLSGSEAGVGGFGGYSAAGNANWFNLLARRGTPAFSIWGGSMAFDTGVNWHFGTSTAGLAPNAIDFFTVAVHELGHVLGFGTAPTFFDKIHGRAFTGSHATAANGGTPPMLSADLAHWNQGTLHNGQQTSMQPYLLPGQRYGFTELDFAALRDVGWQISTPATTVPTFTPPPFGSPTTPGNGNSLPHDSLVLSGTADGLAHLVRHVNGTLQADGFAIKPFADFSGVVRSIAADLNGDGVTDFVYATGPGGPARFLAVDGATGAALTPPIIPFGTEFTGGLFLAAADFDGDGRDDVIVSPDQGGGGRVSVYQLNNANQLVRTGDFFGIEDVTFRGGARVAAGDLNGDGVPDLIVGAGFGGGPRVAIFDGSTLHHSKPAKLIGDFYAFPGETAKTLRNGVYLTAGDINGDGRADLIFGAGPGGGPHVLALNGVLIAQGRVAEAHAAPLASFFAFHEADRGGVRVLLRDLTGNGQLDLVAGSGIGNSVAWFHQANPAQRAFAAFHPLWHSTDGVYVG